MSDPRLDRFAARLDALEVEVRARSATSRLTIADGAIDHVESYRTGVLDEFGEPVYATRLVSRVGRQEDGTHGVVILDSAQTGGTTTTATIDQAGGLVSQKATVGTVAGDTYINGAVFESYLTPKPAGVTAWGSRKTVGVDSNTATEVKWLEVQTVLQPARSYRVVAWPTYAASNLTAGSAGTVSLRVATGGADVGVTSTQIQSVRFWMQSNDAWTTPMVVGVVDTSLLTAPLEHRFLITYKAYSPSGSLMKLMAGATYPSILTVEDTGPATADIGIEHAGGVPPPQPPTKQSYWATWSATGSASYDGYGARRYDEGEEMITGLDPSGINGNGTALAIFGGGATTASNPSEVGKTLPVALDQYTTITAVEFYLYAHHTYYGSGATLHYLPGTLTSFPSSYSNPPGNFYSYADWGVGQGKYAPSKAQYTTSVTVGQSPVGLSGYARLDGANGWAHPPVMRVSYIR